MKIDSKKGFTLIELLVVIAIIGILAAVIIASLNTARGKARDAQRLATIKQIQTALEFYYDKYGYYPAYTENECGGTEGYTTTSNNFMQSLVTEGFLPAYPKDPNNTNCNLQYAPWALNTGYVVYTKFEYRAKNGKCASGDDAAGWSCYAINYP